MLVYHRVPFFAQAQSHLHLPRDRSMRARCGHPTDCAVTPGHPKQQNSLDIISYLFIAFYSHALSIQKFHEILYLSISIAQSMSEFIQFQHPSQSSARWRAATLLEASSRSCQISSVYCSRSSVRPRGSGSSAAGATCGSNDKPWLIRWIRLGKNAQRGEIICDWKWFFPSNSNGGIRPWHDQIILSNDSQMLQQR